MFELRLERPSCKHSVVYMFEVDKTGTKVSSVSIVPSGKQVHGTINAEGEAFSRPFPSAKCAICGK